MNIQGMSLKAVIASAVCACVLVACGTGRGHASDSVVAADAPESGSTAVFDADSAYSYVERQVAFGPRVPGSEAHRRCGEWLASELRRHGAEVIGQRADLRAFDGTMLPALNILGRFNPANPDRILLLAHWDSRPWADEDPDPEKRRQPVDGANDGASGVGVLLEVARQLTLTGAEAGVDILFVDAEDYGTEGDDESWALGARHFAENPPVADFAPRGAILLDMVGGKDAVFCLEYFSRGAAPELLSAVWDTAARAGYGDYFRRRAGGAVTDDHLEFIRRGIPAIDIIEYNPDGDSGFNPRWHTSSDNMEGIDRATLKATGQTITNFIIP